MPALAISDLNLLARILYSYVKEFYNPAIEPIGSYWIVASCADCAGLAREFDTHYPASDWEGCGIDLRELILWAHSLG